MHFWCWSFISSSCSGLCCGLSVNWFGVERRMPWPLLFSRRWSRHGSSPRFLFERRLRQAYDWTTNLGDKHMIALILAALLAQAPPQTAQDISNIEGRVLRAGSQEPIPSVQVTLV